MKIGILGTGVVGQTLASKVASAGHDVMIGTRDPAATMKKAEKDGMGNPPFPEWAAKHPTVKLGTFAEASTHGELVLNALNGNATLEALKSAADALADKVLVDISNPLDFSKGFPPSLSVSNTDSLGEQVQRALPRTKVVKSLNTMNAYLMAGPGQLADGDHTVFVSGNDAGAKGTVTRFLKEAFGWKDVFDLGDITTARGTEQYVMLWVRMFGALQKPMFQIKLVR